MANELKNQGAGGSPRPPGEPPSASAEPGSEELPLTVSERSLLRRLSTALRFADFMALLMVAATAFSAYAAWRTAQVTNRLFATAERPYIGTERVAFDTVDSTLARLVVDCRNFGSVSATNGVVRLHLRIDDQPAGAADQRLATTINVGMFTPTVPHPFHLFVPIKSYEAARQGKTKAVVYIQATYLGPDNRQYCYNEMMSYDYRTDAFDPNGGSDR